MKYLSQWFFYSSSLVPREDWSPYVKVLDLDLIIYETSAKAKIFDSSIIYAHIFH